MNRKLVENHEAPAWLRMAFLLSIMAMLIFLVVMCAQISPSSLGSFVGCFFVSMTVSTLREPSDDEINCNTVEILKGEMN